MTEKELMLSEQLYIANDPELGVDNSKAKRLTHLINTASDEDREKIQGYFRKLLKKTGKNFWIVLPFRCDYGCHISVGENFYANVGCVMLDVGKITIGKNVLFGPNVAIYTAGHPIHPDSRNSGYEYGIPVTIGDNVWIGGSCVILPGVKIGNNAVIGAGSVVTKDIPDNVCAAGNPCKVIREITEEDRPYYYKKQRFDDEIWEKING